MQVKLFAKKKIEIINMSVDCKKRIVCGTPLSLKQTCSCVCTSKIINNNSTLHPECDYQEPFFRNEMYGLMTLRLTKAILRSAKLGLVSVSNASRGLFADYNNEICNLNMKL